MRPWITPSAAFLIVALGASEAQAIPAFARKYKTSCNTCHVVVPKLNDFGEAFRLNGFKIPPDDELLVKDDPVEMGAAALRDVWPDAILPASIPGLPPVSMWIQWGFTQTENDDTKLNFGSPSLIWLIGANIGDDFSFFMEVGPKQRAYLKIDDLLNNVLFGDWMPERALDLRVGLLEPEIVAFSDARRIPITNHLVYNANYAFPNGNGNPFRLDRQIAAELSGILWERFRYVLGVTNGSNDGSDTNSRKDVYYRIAYKLWGLALTGAAEASEDGHDSETLDASQNWTDNSLTLGFFGYHGSNTVPDATVPGSDYDIRFMRFGFDLRANWEDLDLVAAILWGEDSDAANDGVDLGVLSGLVEIDYMILPWLMAYAKFEWLSFKGPNAGLLDAVETQRFVLGATASIFSNLRITMEYRHELDVNDIERDDAFLFRMDVDF